MWVRSHQLFIPACIWNCLNVTLCLVFRWISCSSNRKWSWLRVRKQTHTGKFWCFNATQRSYRSYLNLSARWLRKQQQVRGEEHHGPERLLRCGGERLPEPAVLRAPEALHHPRPGQLRTGDHHHHQAAQVHVLLLPLLSTGSEWRCFQNSRISLHSFQEIRFEWDRLTDRWEEIVV